MLGNPEPLLGIGSVSIFICLLTTCTPHADADRIICIEAITSPYFFLAYE